MIKYCAVLVVLYICALVIALKLIDSSMPRPIIPCDTDTDCQLKNGGNGDPSTD